MNVTEWPKILSEFEQGTIIIIHDIHKKATKRGYDVKPEAIRSWISGRFKTLDIDPCNDGRRRACRGWFAWRLQFLLLPQHVTETMYITFQRIGLERLEKLGQIAKQKEALANEQEARKEALANEQEARKEALAGSPWLVLISGAFLVLLMALLYMSKPETEPKRIITPFLHFQALSESL